MLEQSLFLKGPGSFINGFNWESIPRDQGRTTLEQ